LFLFLCCNSSSKNKGGSGIVCGGECWQMPVVGHFGNVRGLNPSSVGRGAKPDLPMFSSRHDTTRLDSTIRPLAVSYLLPFSSVQNDAIHGTISLGGGTSVWGDGVR
jgi:hypothetical protein